MAKKTTLTFDQAGELEELLTEYTGQEPHGFGNPQRDIQDLLRSVRCPKDVTAALFMHLDSVADAVHLVEDEITRGSCEDVAEGFKRLDAYLEKRFVVTGMPGRRKLYRWVIGG